MMTGPTAMNTRGPYFAARLPNRGEKKMRNMEPGIPAAPAAAAGGELVPGGWGGDGVEGAVYEKRGGRGRGGGGDRGGGGTGGGGGGGGARRGASRPRLPCGGEVGGEKGRGIGRAH